MANNFLKVDKKLFKLGLSPIEILVLAQVTEFNTNTGDCFISDEVLANNFGVSEKTISRTLKALEDKGFISRATKNAKGGKERHIKLSTDKMSLDESQRTNCPLTTDKLSLDNGQNDFIKDKGKDNVKDNLEASLAPNVAKESSVAEYPKVMRSQLAGMGCRFEELGEGLIKICDTGKIFQVEDKNS